MKVPFYKVKVGQRVTFYDGETIYTRIKVAAKCRGKDRDADIHCLTFEKDGVTHPAYCPINSTTEVTIID